MKKILLFISFAFITSASFAGGGWGTSAVNLTSSSESAYNYILNDEGWTDGTWGSNAAFDAYDFGSVTSLILNGGSGNAWANGGDYYDATSFIIYYRAYATAGTPGSWFQLALDYKAYQDGGNYIYDKSNAAVDVLSIVGDETGTYYLEIVMSKDQLWDGGNWKSMVPGGQETAYAAGTAGYKATFEIPKNTFTGTGSWSDDGNWSFGTPASDEDIVISGDVSITSNVTIGDITIDNTFSITINPLIQLTTGAITNNSNSSGVTIKSDVTGNGSLIFSGSGPEAVVWRYIPGYTGADDGWHLISSPVDSYSIGSSDFEPGANDDFFAFDEANYMWMNQKVGDNNITSFENGKGYLVAYELTGDPKNFFGTLNSADITFTDLSVSDGDGWHLLGNPFSSALIWNDGTWALTNIVAAAQVWNEEGGNYSPITASEIIPSTNGFFVQATNGTNSITIKEASRTHNTANNYKSSTSNLMHLMITNDVNSFYDKNRIGINSAATEAFDLAFDSHKLYGNSSAPQLATKIGDEIFSINYLPELISNYDLNLEFKAGVDANYQLLFEGINSFDEDIYITLEDLKTQVFTSLNDVQEYNFTGDSSDEPDRFIIHFFKSGLGIGDLEKSNLRVYAHNSYVMVQNQTNSAGNIRIFDLSGKKIFDNMLSNQELSSYRINAPSGAYIIYVQAGESTIRETIIIAKN